MTKKTKTETKTEATKDKDEAPAHKSCTASCHKTKIGNAGRETARTIQGKTIKSQNDRGQEI